MPAKTVEISNVSLSASEANIREFFSFTGEIDYIELRSGDERSQVAYVTFKRPEAAETAVLLTGSTIVDMSVTVATAMDYELPEAAFASDRSDHPAQDESSADTAESNARKAEEVISTMLAKGLILGSDVLGRAKSFDEKHQLTSTAKSKVSNIDQKMGIREKINTGTSAVNEKVIEMDQKYQVSEKARSAYTVAEQKVSNAGSAAMKNKYVSSSVSWMMETVDKVTKSASEVKTKAVEKAAAEKLQKKSPDDGQGGECSPKTPPVSSSSPTPAAIPETTTPLSSVPTPVMSLSDDSNKL